MTHHKRIYVEANDPRRCQGISMNGEQCRYRAMDGFDKCVGHGGNGVKAANQRIYNVAQWKARIGAHADHREVYNLREDLGVLRILLETQLNACMDDNQLLMRSPAIADLVMRIEKLVPKAAKLEEHFRSLLDINAVANFADTVVSAVVEEIDKFNMTPEDRDKILDRLADKVEAAMPKVGIEE